MTRLVELDVLATKRGVARLRPDRIEPEEGLIPLLVRPPEEGWLRGC